jgi:uracil-DNA glycosylase
MNLRPEVEIEKSWHKILKDYFETESFKDLTAFVQAEYSGNISGKKVYPEPENIFKALTLTPFDEVKVVILGQDPYHGDGQAMGLSFSVPEEVRNPPSLRNIFKELEVELGEKSEAEVKFNGDLSCWAKQGVLLLNSVLTVEAGKPGSHSKKGWGDFTDQVIKKISEEKEGVVFILWGNYAKQKLNLIDEDKHLVLMSPHPSPLSAYSGFFGNDHFIKANQWLESKSKKKIEW